MHERIFIMHFIPFYAYTVVAKPHIYQMKRTENDEYMDFFKVKKKEQQKPANIN